MAFQCIKKLDNGRSCNEYVYTCKKCGSGGCRNRDCSNQNFDPGNGRCHSCGQSGL